MLTICKILTLTVDVVVPFDLVSGQRLLNNGFIDGKRDHAVDA